MQRLRAGEPFHVAAIIERDGTEAEIIFSLGAPPLATATVTLPPGSGRQHVPLSLLIPYQADDRQPVSFTLNGVATTMSWVEVREGRSESSQPVEIAPDTLISATFGDPSLAELVGYDLAGNKHRADNWN